MQLAVACIRELLFNNVRLHLCGQCSDEPVPVTIRTLHSGCLCTQLLPSAIHIVVNELCRRIVDEKLVPSDRAPDSGVLPCIWIVTTLVLFLVPTGLGLRPESLLCMVKPHGQALLEANDFVLSLSVFWRLAGQMRLTSLVCRFLWR